MPARIFNERVFSDSVFSYTQDPPRCIHQTTLDLNGSASPLQAALADINIGRSVYYWLARPKARGERSDL